MKNKLPTFVIIFILAAVLGLGFYVLQFFIMPRFANLVVNKALNVSSEAIDSLDFSNADVAKISQDLSKNKGMFLGITLTRGLVNIDGESENDSLTAEIRSLGARPIVKFETRKDDVFDALAIYLIQGVSQEGDKIDLHLSQKTNTRIDIASGVGNLKLDLQKLDIPVLNVSHGTGDVSIKFSDENSTVASIAIGTGNLNLEIPKGAGVRFVFPSESSYKNLKFAENYIRKGNVVETINFTDSLIGVQLTIGQGVGNLNINHY